MLIAERTGERDDPVLESGCQSDERGADSALEEGGGDRDDACRVEPHYTGGRVDGRDGGCRRDGVARCCCDEHVGSDGKAGSAEEKRCQACGDGVEEGRADFGTGLHVVGGGERGGCRKDGAERAANALPSIPREGAGGKRWECLQGRDGKGGCWGEEGGCQSKGNGACEESAGAKVCNGGEMSLWLFHRVGDIGLGVEERRSNVLDGEKARESDEHPGREIVKEACERR